MRILLLFIIMGLLSCNGSETPETDPDIKSGSTGIAAPQMINYSILSEYPHDTSAYTQGLEFHKGKLLESTGDFEGSSLRITDYKTGKVEQIHKMGTAEIFGEGITVFKNKIYQLTWQNHQVYVYDDKNITQPIKTFQWPYEGWGIAHNDSLLIISDGTSNLYFVHPETFKVVNTVSVRDNNGTVNMLNELEFVNGFVYANVYETNYIVKINPESGHVTGIINLPSLLKPADVVPYRTNVLNGIAYDSTSKRFLITGKRWPKMFELQLN